MFVDCFFLCVLFVYYLSVIGWLMVVGCCLVSVGCCCLLFVVCCLLCVV